MASQFNDDGLKINICVYPCTVRVCTIVHMARLRVIYEDSELVAVEKPPGVLVHPTPGVKTAMKTALQMVRDQVGSRVYPIHRLDRATSGVLLFSKTPEFASQMQKIFQAGEVEKNYVCLVRGWIMDDVTLDVPLKSKDRNNSVEATTKISPLYRFHLPTQMGEYQQTRYTLVHATPITGRTHQIRKHLKHVSHPIIGDTIYGDGRYNRLFRELTKRSNLYLKAFSIKFIHPTTGNQVEISSRWNGLWHQIFDLAEFCVRL